ncbi:hypothetical protein G9C85_12355 [Halorubellus sp. JP-L1]|uniref:hypothetical protein n=1 Tax=Halorubellus sp. JP-L1 TaxID=2715753 RepID=UPI00140A33A4|nr:hypothetical protein [Halorubellus sp. JP-L1]NHN42411.1 hypothetical protein [Halorubellus sp. JP-L1]
MDGKQTVKYVALYQVLATLATVVGLGIVGLGVSMGFGETIAIVLNDAPQNWGDAIAAANPTVFGILAVVGVLVWQVGKSLALVFTIGKVAEGSAGTAGGADVDAAAVKREVLSDVDDRLSGIESDVKRHENRISQASSASPKGSSRSDESEDDASNRRSRRRASESASATGDDADASSDDAESNRRSNRRSSRSSSADARSGSGSSSNGSE